MEKYLSIFKNTKLFKSLNDEEILKALDCLKAKVRNYEKDDILFFENDEAKYINIVVRGTVQTETFDYNGNVNIIASITEGMLIEACACFSSHKRLPFEARWISNGSIISIEAKNLLNTCSFACRFHTILIHNMLKIIADMNIMLAEKINILTMRSTREKILAYLFNESKKNGSNKYIIPLSRQQMAQYLSVDRSALSRELSKLMNEGIIEYSGNKFTLKISADNC